MKIPFPLLSAAGFLTVSLIPAQVSRAQIYSEYQELLNNLGLMETVAGTPSGVDNNNDWIAATMEGGLGIDADLSRPHMAMADQAGNIYIADKAAHAIRKVDPSGIITTVAGTNVAGDGGDGAAIAQMLSNPNGVYVLPGGTFYLLDRDNSKIRRVGLDGMMTTILTDPSGLSTGRGLWVSPDETLIYYAAGTRVRRWREGIGIDDYATGLSSVGNLDVDPDGHLVFTDRTRHLVYRAFDGNVRVRIAGNGTASGGGDGFSALSTGFNEVRGVSFRPDGSYFLCTHKGDQVWFIDTQEICHLLINGADGDILAGDGSPAGSATPMISEPRAVSVAPDGDILITTNDTGYVRRLQSLSPPVPQMQDLIFAKSGDVQISWEGRPGIVYKVFGSPDLATWVELGESTGDLAGAPTTFWVSSASGVTPYFYRVGQK
jgi:hypothetical protein